MIKKVQQASCLLLLSFSLTTVLSAENAAQNRCINTVVNPCIQKCQIAGDASCHTLCQENATNECRQAGE